MTSKDAGRLPLRRRLFLAMTAMLFSALAVASIAFYFMAETLETTVLNVFLEQEMSVIKKHMTEDPGRIAPRISSLQVFRQGDSDLPETLRRLPVGQYHDIRIGDDRYEILIDTVDGRRLWLLFDIDRIERVADSLFMLIGLLFLTLTAVSAWLSYRIARRLSSPIGRLADRVEKLRPGELGTRLGPDFRGEEVERIAGAFDRYLERIEGFVEREQAFTSAASHELRTPLAVLQGATELLDAQLKDPRQRKALARIERARRDMLEFIDALLSLSREEPSGSGFRAETRVDEVMQRICRDARELLHDKPVEIHCGVACPLLVNAPPSLVTILLSNLMRNAVAHTKEGRIDISMTSDSLVITDSGDGIPDEMMDRIFERHFSGRGGSGMGLYIVKRIVDRYGWKIEIQSLDDGGTRATVTF